MSQSRWFLMLTLCASLALCGVSLGCGDDDETGESFVTVEEKDGDTTTYGGDENVVVTEDGTFVVTGDPNGQCVQIGPVCVDIDEAEGRYCGDENAQADYIVVDGEVVDVVCYPPDDAGQPIEEVVVEGDGDVALPQNANGAVVVFDEGTDGEEIEGDFTVDAERTVIFGNGIDETIFADDLTVASNNSRVRAVTVKGNVTYTNNSNNSALVFCKVHGDVTAESNGFTIAGCDVFGDLTVSGNDATLSDVGVGGRFDVNSRATCQGCFSFADDDEDFQVDDDEVGDDLCDESNRPR